MKKKILAMVLAVAAAISMAACGAQDELVGTWDIRGEDSASITFYEDGVVELKESYFSTPESGTYEKIGNGQVRLQTDYGDNILNYTLDKTNGTINISSIE